MEIVYIWIGLAALLTMRLIGEVNSFGNGWAYLSSDQKSGKVLTKSRDATYYKGKGSPRDSISNELELQIFKRDGGKCVHCGAECFLHEYESGKQKKQNGHWISNSLGGLEVFENLHISCYTCNSMMRDTIILQPAIDFAASREETICIEGLEVYEGVYRITELLERAAA